MKPKIIIDDNIPYIQGRLEPVADVEYVDQFGFTPANVRNADAMVIRTRTRCNSSLLAESGVKIIATATIGVDQIDIPWCQNAGIKVVNSPGCNAPAVAQYVWSALLRKGFDPKKQTLGIVGCGNVGSIVAQWGHLLGARILVSDPPKQAAAIAPHLTAPAADNPVATFTIDNRGAVSAIDNRDVTSTYEYVSLETLMRECDAVTLHTPLTRDGSHPTFHLISHKEIAAMKPGAIFINAARGPVLDTQAILPSLRDGKISAVIDTWEGEPDINRELLDLADIATFHIAGYSRQGKERATRMVLEELEKFFGFEVDKSGLAPAYISPKDLTAESIICSYDPAIDTAALRSDPAAFDTLRRNYRYREEVS